MRSNDTLYGKISVIVKFCVNDKPIKSLSKSVPMSPWNYEE